jgi:hypothetical protein
LSITAEADVSTFELENWTELARADAGAYADSDPTYTEIMATCALLGAALLPGYVSSDLHGECKDLEQRIFDLTRQAVDEAEQRWLVWQARNTGPRLRVVR